MSAIKIEKLEEVTVGLEDFEYDGVVFERSGVMLNEGGSQDGYIGEEALPVWEALGADVTDTCIWLQWESEDKSQGIDLVYELVPGEGRPSLVPAQINRVFKDGDGDADETVKL